MPRSRLSTKKLAQRIDMDYFKRAHPFRRLRSLLSIGIPLLALIWLGWFALARNNRVYSSGTLASSHAVLTQECGACHLEESGVFSAKASDRACESCHDGPIHHANQAFQPNCSACHQEHHGRMRLAATSDASCTQCHANLRANGASPHVVNSVTRFDGGHPEFAALRPGSSDPGTIKLNHAIHLRHDLKGPGGPVQLDCSDCHRTSGASEPWKFGSATPASAPGNAPAKANDIPPSKQMGRANMAPIAYAKHCSACHGLRFDSRFPDQVPHDTPAVIHAFVLQKFQQYIPSHPSELRVPARDRNLPQQSVPASRVLTSQEWVTMRVAESEELLWRKTCSECHSVTFAPNASLPSIAKSNIAPRWFAHAVFDHDAHKFLKCVECHAGAPTSQSTAEVLLPGIQTCEKCHHHGAESAESRCFECHTYHDWTKEKPVKGKFIFRASVAKTGNAGLQ